MFWLGSAPSLMPLGSHWGWAHLSRALQAGSAVCWIDFSPRPSRKLFLGGRDDSQPKSYCFPLKAIEQRTFSWLFAGSLSAAGVNSAMGTMWRWLANLDSQSCCSELPAAGLQPLPVMKIEHFGPFLYS